MKILYLIMNCCLFSTALLTAQDHVLFREDFENNDRQWLIQNQEGVTTAVADGVYRIQHKNRKSGRVFHHDIYINPRHNFYIETKLTQVRGTRKHGSGLLWGMKDVGNMYSFIITNDGYFRISMFKKRKYYHVKAWTYSKYINGMGKPNVLAVEKKRFVLNYYINGHKVHQTPYPPLFGNKIGFDINYNTLVEVDYLLVKHPPVKINLIPQAQDFSAKENLGNHINSPHAEVAPVISPDGKTLYLVRDKHPQNIVAHQNNDIWMSQRLPDNTWSPAKNMGKPLSNEGHNQVVSVMPDGNTLLLNGTYGNSKSPQVRRGLYLTNRTQNGWTTPVPVQVKNYYNRAKFVSECLSADGKTLILSVERKDTHGQRDLYVSFMQADNVWSEPLNLGMQVNTFADDITPFLAADNVTLYYSTRGEPGYGDNDIFVTRRLDNTWTNWSTPQNLGKGINTPDWDAYYTIPASGEHAYFVSYEKSLGKSDIFRVKLPDAAKPKPVVLVHGKVLNKLTQQPIGATITYEDLKTRQQVGVARSNPGDGTYTIVLPYEKVYGFNAEKEGYYPVSKNLDLLQANHYREVKHDLYLVPLNQGQSIRLNNLFFDYNQDTLKPSSYPELNRLIKILKKHPQMNIEISGHTDAHGSADKNLTLSQARANSVLRHLTTQGIAKQRLRAKGYGQGRPVADNTTATGRALNRRVEFLILKE